ncbi:MAG: LamG domain-containing protein [Candidatus Pacearchaeota archaeon]
MIRGGRLSTVQGKQTLEAKQSTVNRKQLTALILSSVLLISFVAITIATGFFGINTTKISSLEKGLVAHYPLDGIHQTKDITPYGNHGTNHGATLTTGVKDEPEGAYSFDGVNGHIEMNSYSHTSGNGTISLWVKTSSNSNQIIIGSYNGLAIGIYDKDKLIGTSQQLGRKPLGVMGESFELNKWQHLVVTLNEGNIKYYLDGNLLPTTSDNLWSWETNVAIIGRRSSGGTSLYHFNGSLSDVRIYNRALSEDEIQLLFDSYKPTASTSDLNKGLVGHWMLDAENGAKDLTPYGNHGTAQGGVIIGGVEDRKGKSNGATSFDGSNDYINYGNVNGLTGSFTISVWVNPSSFPTNSVIVSKGASSTFFNNNYVLALRNNHVRFKGTFSNSIELDSQTILSTNTWYHIVGVYNQELQKANIYIDGLKDTKENTNCKTPNTVVDNFFMGGFSSYCLDGSISDVRIYNRALSEDEIQLLYDSYKPKEASVGNLNKGLILDMPLTTKYMKSDTIVADRTPYGNDGTLMNGVNITNEGAVFDGVDDYVEIPHDDMQLLKNGGTISVWINPKAISKSHRVLDKSTSGTDGQGGYAFYLYSSTKTATLVFNNGGSIRSSSPALVLNEWTHLVFTFDNTGFIKGYTNGDLVISGSSGSPASSTTTSPLTIGNRAGYTDRTFSGSISNLKMYNHALSDEEAKLLYEKGRW